MQTLAPIREVASRGYRAWEPIYDNMNGFLYKMFSVKMNQEEEAPMLSPTSNFALFVNTCAGTLRA